MTESVKVVVTATITLAVMLCPVKEAFAQRKPNPFYEPPDPKLTAADSIALAQAWHKIPPGLHGAFGSIDLRYSRNRVPTTDGSAKWSGTAWRGERLSAQLLLWSSDHVDQVRLLPTPLTDGNGRSLGTSSLEPRFLRYTLGDGGLHADILDPAERLPLPANSVRPVWISLNIPHSAFPGPYRGSVSVKAAGEEPLTFELEVEVLEWELPPVSGWSFHLDLWQNPYAVARYHHMEPWSAEHFSLLEPHMRLLLEAGQKVITTTILYRPWGTQTFDPYDSMVEWIRRKDGTWSFDYSVFDKWVEFATGIGFTGPINCYSTVPWTNQVRYRDEVSGDYRIVEIPAGGDIYIEVMTPFLQDFTKHLRDRGWLERVVLAMDERPVEQMMPAIKLIREHAPGLRIALAGGNHPELKDEIDDWCVFVSPPLDEAIIAERNQRKRSGEDHLETTFYLCCNPDRPNTFTQSPPAESAWIGLYAAARDLTGFLRWAYDSWVEDPIYDTRHVTWSAGDCFLVYPGARSSIRFERLREGIQEYEKIRILREVLGNSRRSEVRGALGRLEETLEALSYRHARQVPVAGLVNDVKEALLGLSRYR